MVICYGLLPMHCVLYRKFVQEPTNYRYYSSNSSLCYSVCKSLLYAHLEPTNFTAQQVPLIGGSLAWNGIPPIPPLLQWAPRVETSSCGIMICWIRELSYRGWDEAELKWRIYCSERRQKVFGHFLVEFTNMTQESEVTFEKMSTVICLQMQLGLIFV